MIKQDQKIRIESARNKMPTAVFFRDDGRELYLHSRFDPRAEARFLISGIPVKEKTLYVILGFGLGYHVKELLTRIPGSSRVMVVEPGTQMLSVPVREYYLQRREKWIQDRRLIFANYNSPEHIPFDLVQVCVKEYLSNLEVYTHIPSASTDPGFFKTVVRIIPRDFAVRFNYHLFALDSTLENSLANYWSNLSQAWRSPHAGLLAGKWEGTLALVVASGPSLTQDLEWLKKAKGKALVICVGSAAKVLAENGIEPDFVVSVDPYVANMPILEGWDCNSIPLIYYQRIWRGIPKVYGGPKFWFTMANESPVALTAGLPHNPFLAGGTVTTSAIQFARYVKAHTVALVGQDFSYPGDRTHAEGACGNRDPRTLELAKSHTPAVGISGNPVFTNSTLQAYKLFMEEYLRRQNDVRYINTSRTGLHIQGTEPVPLRLVIEGAAAFPPVNSREMVGMVCREFQMPEKSKVKAFVDNHMAELARFLADTAEMTDFKKVVARFKKLPAYRQNPRDYDDIFYTMETQILQGEGMQPFTDRLKSHCLFIMNELKQILQDWE